MPRQSADGEESIESRTRARRSPKSPRVTTPSKKSSSLSKEKTKNCVDFYKQLTEQNNLIR
jgi:hypothetical protein